MPSFQLRNSDGSPASTLQVIIKNPGHWDYALSDIDGQVDIPASTNYGSVIVGGQTIYEGILEGVIYLP